MAGFEDITVQRKHDPMDWEVRKAELEQDEDAPEIGEHPLDSYENQQTLNQLEEWYENTRIIQSANRYEQAIDEDYYDGLQWSDEDKAELEARGQAALVFNEIKPAIDWIIGTERRTRTEWKVHPRTDDDVKDAQTKTQLLKYVSDVNKIRFNRSFAFAEAVKVGVGWLEDGAQDETFGDEPLFSRHESWRKMWYDPLATAFDLDDARFIFREKWVDLDIAISMFPEREQVLRAKAEHHYLMPTDEDEFLDTALYYNADYMTGRRSTSTIDEIAGTMQNRRARVRLIEGWYRKPCKCQVFKVDRYAVPLSNEYTSSLQNHHGMDFDENHPEMRSAIENGLATVVDSNRLKMHVSIFVKGFMLQNMITPYRHNRFPFTPVWGYRRGRDRTAYGVIRNVRDPQEDLNKRRSKALHILSTNRIIMDKGAVDDVEELRDEAADPAGVIVKNLGHELIIDRDNSLAQEHIMLEVRDGEYIRNVSGVTGENLGRETTAKSGKAIEAKQVQGSATTAELFDNLMYAMQIQGEKQLSLTEQFYDYPKVIRVTDDRGNAEFSRINSPDETGERIENDITRSKADFVISAQDFRESVRIAMFEQMIEMIGSMDSQIALQLLDLVFELSDLPGKDELVRRIREINGQPDPDNQDDPEEQARRAAQDQQAADEAQLVRDTQVADLQERIAKAKKLSTESNKNHIEMMEKALELVEKMKTDPQLAPAADALINSLTQEAA